jgi:hypothetical protein
MKTQRTTRGLLSVALCTLVLGSYTWADGGFLDDFSDGSIQDGSPVTWRWDASMGTCAVTPEGLEVSPKASWPLGLRFSLIDEKGENVHYTGNVTIRARLNLCGMTTVCGLLGLATEDYQGGYYLGFNTTWLFLSRDSTYCPTQWHSATTGRFDAQEDIIVQLDVIAITDDAGNRTGSRLECRWWLPGQEMPAQAHIVGTDSVYDVSSILFGAGSWSAGSKMIFRWIEVTGSEIEVEPIVDFNGDGMAGMKDLLRLIDAWGQDDPAVDIVPDGVVDQKDLEVLMDYWLQDVNDPTLLAHWALDETEGTIAHDSVGLTPGTVLGGAVWRPDAGQLAGALEFDGVDDVITAGAVVNPSNAPFSVLAWVKGGAPSQVIFSQMSGANWLMADASQGLLKTELRSTGRFAKLLCSQATITDGDWHRVALVCDGSNRILYVDDVAAAQDVQTDLTGASGNLLIGAGSTLAPGTFWSGLIDDVRIYNRTVKP